MKKWTLLCFSLLIMVIVAGCSSDEQTEPNESETTETSGATVEIK